MTTIEAPAEIPSGTCREAGCTAATDGVCARGGDPIDCDFFDLEPTTAEPGDVEPPPPAVSLPHGRALRPSELSAVLARRPATRVVPLGSIEAGKTTLFAVLFEFLTAGRLSAWSYVRSETTLGFMERSHDASMRSKRAEPTSPRTSHAAGDQVLHVDARRRSTGEVASLLYADVSGEHVEQLTTTGQRDPALMTALAGAHHVPLLIDGQQAANPQQRQNAIRHAIDLVNVLPDLPRRADSTITLVLTKVDNLADGDADAVLDRVRDAARARLGIDPPTFKVAARPKRGSGVAPGTGIEELLDFIVGRPEPQRQSAFPSGPPAPSPQLLRRIWRVRR